MSQKQQSEAQSRAHWLRIGFIALTTVGPILNRLMQFRHRSRELRETVVEKAAAGQEAARNVREDVLERLDEFTLASRKLAAQQAKQLQRQARQLQKQARLLRRALRRQSRRRRQLNRMLKRLQKAGPPWSQELLRRSEDLASSIVEQSSKISQSVIERGSEVTQDIAERSSQAVQALTGRRRRLFRQERRQNTTLLAMIGFAVGLAAAAAVTYWFVRRRMAEQEIAESEHIELPQQQAQEAASMSRPVGEIVYMDSEGTPVAILEVDIDSEVPADAAFVGVSSTKLYYPLATFRERFSTAAGEIAPADLVYFASEEEAREQGFSPAE